MSDGKHCLFKGSSYFNGLGCKKISHNYPDKDPQEFYTCPSIYHTRMCDTQVDIRVLQSGLEDLYRDSLCKMNISTTSTASSSTPPSQPVVRRR